MRGSIPRTNNRRSASPRAGSREELRIGNRFSEKASAASAKQIAIVQNTKRFGRNERGAAGSTVLPTAAAGRNRPTAQEV